MLVARRNLLRDRTRFALSVAGVAVSVGLILILAGYRSGIYRQAAAYLDNAPGGIVVAERGIRDFLGTTSALPASAEAQLRRAPGVSRVVPIVSQFVVFERDGRKDGFLLIGYDPVAGGGPWELVDGREPTADDELVIDRAIARQHGIVVGDRIGVLDRPMAVVGLSEGTTFWAGSLAFARMATVESLLRAPGRRSFLLVTPSAGESAEAVRDRLALPGAEVLLKSEVIANDARLIGRVYDAPIGLMVAIGFFIGVLVVALVIYTATIERRREYGTMKAIGVRNRVLYRVVTTQALVAAGAGAVVGVALAYIGGAALMAWRPQFRVDVEPSAVAVVLAGSLIMAVFAALVPARSIAGLEPAGVFRS